jgi:hypothetical protein
MVGARFVGEDGAGPPVMSERAGKCVGALRETINSSVGFEGLGPLRTGNIFGSSSLDSYINLIQIYKISTLLKAIYSLRSYI